MLLLYFPDKFPTIWLLHTWLSVVALNRATNSLTRLLLRNDVSAPVESGWVWTADQYSWSDSMWLTRLGHQWPGSSSHCGCTGPPYTKHGEVTSHMVTSHMDIPVENPSQTQSLYHLSRHHTCSWRSFQLIPVHYQLSHSRNLSLLSWDLRYYKAEMTHLHLAFIRECPIWNPYPQNNGFRIIK